VQRPFAGWQHYTSRLARGLRGSPQSRRPWSFTEGPCQVRHTLKGIHYGWVLALAVAHRQGLIKGCLGTHVLVLAQRSEAKVDLGLGEDVRACAPEFMGECQDFFAECDRTLVVTLQQGRIGQVGEG
jgi:hypothetical protein